MTLKQVIEALVFASPKPITTKEIVAALKAAGEGTEEPNALDYAATKDADVITLLEELQMELPAAGRAFHLVEKVNGWTLVSDPACAAWVRQLYPEAKPTRLTGPQLETLAIIAYRQPVTRADCEAVRGVAVDGVMQVLLDRGLVKIAGRAEVPGRPLLYSTTEYFLQHFGLKTTDDLPNAGELKRVALPKAEIPEAEPKEPKAPKEPKEKKSKKSKVAEEGSEAKPAEGEAAAAAAPAEGTPAGETAPATEGQAPAEGEPAPEPESAEPAEAPEPSEPADEEPATSTGEPFIPDEPAPETEAPHPEVSLPPEPEPQAESSDPDPSSTQSSG